MKWYWIWGLSLLAGVGLGVGLFYVRHGFLIHDPKRSSE